MRRTFIILLIALLPVRIWAADVMAVSMAAQQVLAPQEIQVAASARLGIAGEKSLAQTLVPLKATMASDCPMMSLLAGQKLGPTDSSVNSKTFKVCTTCQLCMALVTGYASRNPMLTPLPNAVVRVTSTSFTSAERAPGFKPPIS